MKLNVTWCPRCHENHGQMEFVQLDNPKGSVDHWAECPTTHHPILTNVVTMIGRQTQPTKVYGTYSDGQTWAGETYREEQQSVVINLW